jgi:hypothetical protein
MKLGLEKVLETHEGNFKVGSLVCTGLSERTVLLEA